MYSYIKGVITLIESDGIVIENNKIGYKILVANPYRFKVGNEYQIYLYNHVREDEYSLFGFNSIEEKNLFMKLISVKGLGPKIGLLLISGDNDYLIRAIDSSDVEYIKKYPKVGEKLARQIILDLKGKLVKTEADDLKCSDEVISALENLGYKKADIKKIINNVDSSETLENQIKEALKLLLKS